MKTTFTILITAAVVGGGVYFYLNSQAKLEVNERLPKLTAQEAYNMALPRATGYSSDFYLTAIDGDRGGLEPDGGSDWWKFYFANDKDQGVSIEIVDGEIGLIEGQPISLVEPDSMLVASLGYSNLDLKHVTPISDGWMDSGDAASLSIDICGNDLPVDFKLRPDPDDLTVFWSMRCGPVGQTNVFVDAYSGETSSYTFLPE